MKLLNEKRKSELEELIKQRPTTNASLHDIFQQRFVELSDVEFIPCGLHLANLISVHLSKQFRQLDAQFNIEFELGTLSPSNNIRDCDPASGH